MKKILIPLPCQGFDPTEAAIPWKLLSDAKIDITFITPDGKKSSPDQLMLEGKNLGIWKSTLRARKDAVDAFNELSDFPSFIAPLKYTEVSESDFNGLLLPGGHDKSIREYLESEQLQSLIVGFFNAKKPVAAICHGTVLVARSINPVTDNSVIHNYKTTSLLKTQELLAYNMTRLWLKDYYLTYPGLCVEDEVTSALAHNSQFQKGPSPLLRDDINHLKRGFCVKDRNYLSARWPGDVYSFSLEFIKMINGESL